MTRKNMFLWGLGGALLIAMTAGASAYIATKAAGEGEVVEATRTAQADKINWDGPAQQQAQQPAAKSCDDSNIVGAAIGAVAGGVAGNQIGSGKGQDLATIGGAIGGGALGQRYIPTRNALCP